MDVIIFSRHILISTTFFLIVWISLGGANGIQAARHPTCHFTSFCSCSKNGPDLGIVSCQYVHLPRIPEAINTSKVYTLHLTNNDLRTIEPYFLQSTGLYKIVINNNPLYYIPDEAFLGLERSLWELELSHTALTSIPNRALRHLRKLRVLDLTGNSIAKLAVDNWRGLENSLISLRLADNSITHLPTDSFSGLPLVETIDLRGNNLKEIDPSVFRDGMEKLTTIILADNQLSAIPYQALSYLKALKHLDLSFNKIGKMQPATDIGVQNVNYNFQFNLDELKLDYNQMTALESGAFQYFNMLNKTSLDGNPINLIEENAFRSAKIRELYLRQCALKEISPLAFSGLENSLEILDLSGNHISELHEEIFHRFELLKSLSIRDNSLTKIDIQSFNGLQFSLHSLDLSGNDGLAVNLQDIRRFRSLRTLSMSRLSKNVLSEEDFLEYGVDLEEFSMTFGGLKKIKNNAFKHVHGLRKLQFSDNKIEEIENNAFIDIEASLKFLDFSHGLSANVLEIPHNALKVLHNLEHLDFSNNKIRNLPDTSFHFLHELEYLNLADNIIETIHKGTFQGDIHTKLKSIYLSFNNIKNIQQHTFSDLKRLQELHLDDNRIDTIDRRAFMNLENLKRLNLKGNNIATVLYEAFQNLPELENLDLAYNKLNSLDFSIFDQVGSLATFHVNLSHNSLEKLVLKSFESDSVGSQNIKVLDLSFNNITSISKQFFKPIELSLTHLLLSHNKLLNATKDTFGHIPHLQILNLNHNSLYEIDFDTFRSAKKLEHLYVSHNRIAEIPHDLFRFSSSLKLVDFSHNRLRSLPDNLFREAGLERLDVSHNLLAKLPLSSLSVASAETLCELDLSWNGISSLSHGGQLSRFRSLATLDLSYNRLGQIDAGTFKAIPKLSSLNFGHNSQLTLEVNGLSFQGLENSLVHLNLDNVSLSQVPTLSTPNLLSLSLAFNALPTVSPEIASNISSIRYLNLDYNDLSTVPIVTHSLTELRALTMAGNPISTLSNTSLLGVAHQLEYLDVRDLDLNILETGAFCKMQSLRSLKVDLYQNVKNYNVPWVIQFNDGLKNLEIFVDKEVVNMQQQMTGAWPSKLRNLTLSGNGFKTVTPVMLEGIKSPLFTLNLRNTSITIIPSTIFDIMDNVRNISVDVENNRQLKNLQNPSTGLKLDKPKSTFLIDLKLSGNHWNCDCDLGWVEVWQRKKRQYLCGDSPSFTSNFFEEEYNCRHTNDDLRKSFCNNRNNMSVIDVLKTEIECGWSKAALNLNVVWFIVIGPIISTVLI